MSNQPSDDLKKYIDHLKDQNAHWICKYTAAEQKYQSQAAEMGELRAERESIDGWKNVAAEQARNFIDAEQRELKLKEAIESAMSWTWDCGENNMTEVVGILTKVIDTLYPLERKDTK